jgi:hypothetical protein
VQVQVLVALELVLQLSNRKIWVMTMAKKRVVPVDSQWQETHLQH